MPLLQVEKLSKSFGGLLATANVNMDFNQGDLVGLIGPNGAGKTTLFNMLTGVYTPTSGKIVFNGKSVVGLKPYEITKRGMARTFQNIRLFSEFSALDNIKVALNFSCKQTLPEAMLRVGRYYADERRITARAEHFLEIFELSHRRDDYAKNLSYGEQRRLEIARAMATEPKLLLLDEPAAGMNPQETAQLTEMLRWIREEYHLTILLIEHYMHLVMGLCEKIYVLEYGRMIAVGTPDEIKANERVIAAYLGEG